MSTPIYVLEVFKYPNKTYKITRNIDTTFSNIEIPENCILEFYGKGSFSTPNISNTYVNLNGALIYPLGLDLTKYFSEKFILSNFAKGQIVFDSSLGKMKLYNGEDWVNLDGSLLDPHELRFKTSKTYSSNSGDENYSADSTNFCSEVEQSISVIGDGETLGYTNPYDKLLAGGTNNRTVEGGSSVIIDPLYSTTRIYPSQENMQFSIPNKEYITRFYDGADIISSPIDIKEFKNSLNITSIYCKSMCGNTCDIKNLTKLKIFGWSLNTNLNNLEGNLIDFSNKENLEWLTINKGKIKGNLSDISNLTNLIYVNLEKHYTDKGYIQGNIESLNKLTALQTLTVTNCNVEGSIETLIEGQIQNGRISGSLEIRAFDSVSSNITFNNTKIPQTGHICTFNSNGCIVTKKSGVILGTLSDGVWTYN